MRFLALLLALGFAANAAGQVTCTLTGTTAYIGPVAACTTCTATCPSSPDPPHTCPPGQVWNGTTCACPAGTTWNGSACVTPPTGACSATQQSTPFGSLILTRQCAGSASFGNYHPRYPETGDAQLYDAGNPGIAGVWTDKTYKGPFPLYLSGYTMIMPITPGSFISLRINGQNGQMQVTSDPSYGDAGVLSLSTIPGAFTGPNVVTGMYGICSFNYSAANSMWFGFGGTDCPMQAGKDYYVNFSSVTGDGTPIPTGRVSYQIVSSH